MKTIINSLNVFAWMRSLFNGAKPATKQHRSKTTRKSFKIEELRRPVARSRRATRNLKNHSPYANAKNKPANK